MLLAIWAEKWGVSREALDDLQDQFGLNGTGNTTETLKKGSEAAVMNEVRVEACKKGLRLWRNNVGAVKTDTGFIRYGLANESGKMNQFIKSADLIGIRPVEIIPEMVGGTIGQFVSREIKARNWVFKNTDREKAQKKWIELITALGGDACFTNGKGTL